MEYEERAPEINCDIVKFFMDFNENSEDNLKNVLQCSQNIFYFDFLKT